LICAVFFAGVEKERSWLYGRYPAPGDNLWRINPSMTLVFARDWYNFGILKSNFIPRYRFSDSNIVGQGAYLSYPPTFAFEPYVLAKIKGRAPQLEDVMKVGSLNHLACAMLVAGFVFFLARLFVSPWMAAGLALAPGLLLLMIPAAFLFFPFGWWADMAGLPFFAAMLALEASASRWKNPRALRLLQALVAFAGVFTDWLFFLLLAAMVLKDLSARPRRWRWELWLIPLAYVLFHFMLVERINGWALLWAKLSLRTGLSAEGIGFWDSSRWLYRGLQRYLGGEGHLLYLFLLYSFPLVVILFFRRWRFSDKARAWVESLFLLSLPIHLHAFVLHQHYLEHPYNSVKFALLVCAAGFGLLPLLPLLWLERRRWAEPMVLAGTVVAAGFYLMDCETLNQAALAKPMSLDQRIQDRCQEVFSGSSPAEISFSPHFATDDLLAKERKAPPSDINDWARPACGRNVYLASRPRDIVRMVKHSGWLFIPLEADVHFQLWTVGAPPKDWLPFLLPGTEKKTGELQVQELSRKALLANLAEE
jgi:hypothetical protein